MPSLYVSEPGATLRFSSGSLSVTAPVRELEADPLPHSSAIISVQPDLLESVIIIGHNHVTADALRFLMEKGITVSWVSRGGRLVGRTITEMTRSADLRLMQYSHAIDEAGRLERARSVVTAKIENSTESLIGLQSNEPGEESLASAIASLKNLSTQATLSTDINQLTGLEGAAAKDYFAAYAIAFKGQITFSGRNRRPPKDPANAMLSFAYTLLGNMIGALLEARGLDPSIGCFHQLRSGRHSLALDLLEELRSPVVDRFVLRSCNLRIMRPEMFCRDQEKDGVFLTPEGRKSFFMAWEKSLLKPLRCKNDQTRPSVHQVIRNQVDEYAASLRAGRPYRPFLYGG